MSCILLIGSGGLIGSQIKLSLEKSNSNIRLISVDQSQRFDLNDRPTIIEFFKSNSDINYILNCSGLNDHVSNGSENDNGVTDLAALDAFMQINVKSVCWLIEDAHSYLPDIKGIVNFSSLYGIRSPFHPAYRQPKSLSYTLSKHALEGVTRYYSAFYGPDKLRVNAIRVGGIEADAQPLDFKDWFVSRIPLARMAKVEDLLGVVELLCSEKSAYITGQNFTVDGGYSTW